jgi:hypothetical protein
MSTSFRFVRRGVTRGVSRSNFNLPGIIKSAQAVVHISAGEIAQGPRTTVGTINQDFIYIIGDANVWISNISPHFNSNFGGEEGGVGYNLHVEWGSDNPIDVAITITVEDNTPVGIQN